MSSETTNWAAICDQAFAGFQLSSMSTRVELPALPYVVTLFVQRSRHEGILLKDLAEILETDSALTVELLKHVNSSSFGLRTKAKTVLQALSLLGLGRSRLFVIATGIEAAMRARFSKLIDQTAFWSDNLQKAIFAREVANLLRTDPDIAFIGGLLQDYLLPCLTNDLADQYAEFFKRRETPPPTAAPVTTELPSPASLQTLNEFEQSRFGWDHALAGACLARAWKLPDELVCCILYHHEGLSILGDAKLGRSPVAATALSALLPDQFSPDDHGLELLTRLEAKWPAFCLEKLAESVDRQHAEMGLGISKNSLCSKVAGRATALGDPRLAGVVAAGT